MSISAIAYTWNRNGDRVRHFLKSLLWQTIPPSEIIFIDTSSDPAIRTSIAKTVSEFPQVRYVVYPTSELNAPLAYNFGIQLATSEFVAIANLDMLYSPNTFELVSSHLARNPNLLVMTERGTLPEHTDLNRDWDELVSSVDRWWEHLDPGNLQVCRRDFLIEARGFDERWAGGLGGTDDNLRVRAAKAGIKPKWLHHNECQALHMYHPISPLKGTRSHLFTGDAEVKVNAPDQWGFRLRGLNYLSLDITHRCNLSCAWCSKRVADKPYTFSVTMEQIEHMLSCIDMDHVDIVRLSGGEPLIHPQFEDIVWKLDSHYKTQKISVVTNGKFLYRLSPEVFKRLMVLISHYPGINDGIVASCESFENVTILRTETYRDPRHDPKLSESEARVQYAKCGMVQVRVIGDKVYPCCLADVVESLHGITGHVKLAPQWRTGLSQHEKWRSCQRCPMANWVPFEDKT